MEVDEGASSTQDSFLLEQLESEICDRLRNLDLSQQSIEKESNYLIKLQLPQGTTSATFLVDLIVRFILRAHRSKKLPYIYLANDLIQKSLIKHKKLTTDGDGKDSAGSSSQKQKNSFNDFHEAFAPPKINRVLV